MSFRQFVPPLLVLSLVASLLFFFIPIIPFPLSLFSFVIIFGSYLLANLVASIATSTVPG